MRHPGFLKVIAAFMAVLFFVQSIVPTRVYALENTGTVISGSGTEPAGSEPTAPSEPDALAGDSQQGESHTGSGDGQENDPMEATVPETTKETVPETTKETVPETTKETVPETTGETVPKSTEETVPETTEETVPETTEETIPEEVTEVVYEEGTILLYTYEQLLKIGSGAVVTDGDARADTLGTGAPILREDGSEVTYGLDALYCFANGIPLPAGTSWQLPLGFTGRIAPKSDTGEKPLYNAEFNTICVYNPCQLGAIQDGAQTPVMTGDVSAEQFGTGEKLYPNGEEGEPLTYSLEHTYVLSAWFCSDMPEIQEEATPPVWQEGVINLYCVQQLLLVGSGTPVTDGDFQPETLGKGKPVQNEDGEEVTYAPDGIYRLMGDIPLPKDFVWEFPDEFSGSFTGGEAVDETAKLYDSQTDTVYLYNLSQLAAIQSEDSGAAVVVCSQDMLSFGQGEPVCREDGTFVTYSRERNYVITTAFRWEFPVAMLAELGPLDPEGRDEAGQAVAEIGGKTYVLIGDRQQLQALDDYSFSSDKNKKTPVTGPIWKLTYARDNVLTKMTLISAELVYPGDAHLVNGLPVKTYTYGEYTTNEQGNVTSVASLPAPVIASGTKDFASAPLYGIAGCIETEESLNEATSGWTVLPPTTKRELGKNYSKHNHLGIQIGEAYVGGTLDAPDESVTSYSWGEYDTGGNYIIFRNIDLNSETWYPLMFNGTMIGAKASGVSTLWSADKAQLNVNTAEPAVIRNIAVTPKLEGNQLEVTQNAGVGFFGTISAKYSDSLASQAAVVKNITLSGGTVNNPAVSCHVDQTLVSGLTTLLGGLLGGLLDIVLGILTVGQVKLNLSDVLSNLLNARAKDPTSLATGGFAGCIVGKVEVTDCAVENITVTTVTTSFEENQKIVGKGGFVGYVEGTTRYDGISGLAEGLLKLLSSLLNIIPGLGLGDLITILGNTLQLGNLIPVGYDSPVIRNCKANSVSLSLEDGKYGVGGFAGSIVGTTLEGCAVTGTDLTVNAEKYGGGFVGVLADAQIEQLLSALKVDIVPGLDPQSALVGCRVGVSNLSVSGGSCLGGLAGVLANSYAVNCDVSSTVHVNAVGNYAGGVAGLTTVGSLVGEVGGNLVTDSNLLKTVSNLLTGLLGGGSDQALLSLVGVSPSAIMGCQVTGSLTVTAGGNYAGGITGRADGAYITQSSRENLGQLVKYKRGTAAIPAVTARRNAVTNLQSVKAADCAGGVAGLMTTASVAGLLDTTLGVASYIGFHLSETDVTGGGYTVEATGTYAGGGVGMALGGEIADVQLTGLKSVQSFNRAGGFAGCTGPGSLVSDSGLNVTLLGLNILKVGNLLQVVDGIRTTYQNANVTGIPDGFTVAAIGASEKATDEFTAGGYIGKASSVEITDCHVTNLLSVIANDTNGTAGGFTGISTAGGLAEVGEDGSVLVGEDTNPGLIDLGSLLNAAPYLIPLFNNCHVTYVDGGFVQANTAGGFAGDFQSGKVNTEHLVEQEPAPTAEGEETPATPILKPGDIQAPENVYAVHNLDHVTGVAYAGGFGGRVYSGALVSGGGGLNLLGVLKLNITASDLLGLVNAYVPIIHYAGVQSGSAGLLVSASGSESCAGGYVGYGSGVQIVSCHVDKLRHTDVTPPEDLESISAPSYFDGSSQYAVTASAHAGGYIGHMNIGSAATVGSDGSSGGGLAVLGSTLNLSDIASVLDVVVSTIEHSNVIGQPGGFSVLASGAPGDAGGFAGTIEGGHIQDCNAYNFAFIIGQATAGGYVGEFMPGSAAEILGGANVLGGVLETQGSLLSALEDFVPTIRNSETTCVPCGGAVRAQAANLGRAGGYCGHNDGGHIWGNNRDDWKAKPYEGPTRACAAIRILSVYGAEYAGGFTGLMQSADTASTGGLSVLFGLIKVDNPIGALSIVYPTEENTAVYGPLAQLDEATWNSWKEYVGQFGGYGSSLAQSDFANLKDYEYGYNVAAGRQTYVTSSRLSDGGCAGGYVGAMHSGVITNGQAYNARSIKALRASGGFAGEMLTGGATSLGGINILGLKLELGQTISALQTLVPTIKCSSVQGYQSGLTVQADPDGSRGDSPIGYAGGYVGYASGAQIWGDEGAKPGCNVTRLLKVTGTNAIGGYAGLATAASVANVDTGETSSGILQKLLDALVSAPNLVNLLKATVTTIRQASVTAANPEFGFVVDGQYGDQYAPCAGGFAGSLEAAVVGKEKMVGTELTADETVSQTVTGLRGVIGGHYAGGFFGKADTGSVAEVGGENESGDKTNLLLKLIELGNVDVLSAFRSYIYQSSVEGVGEGFTVKATQSAEYGTQSEIRYNGSAGGFGGALMNGSVKSGQVTNLSTVEGPNYVGGFLGHMDKGGVADVGGVDVIGKVLDLGANALNVFGAHAENCTVSGIPGGFVVKSTGTDAPTAGGFAGLADLSRIQNSTVIRLKKVTSGQTAGGFVGETKRTYLVNAEGDSVVLQALFIIVNGLLQGLGVDDLLETLKVYIDLGIVKVTVGDGDVLNVWILGLPISVSLAKGDTVAQVRIGNSVVELKVTKDANGNWVVDPKDPDNSNVVVHLIKANRTEIESCSVTGISVGYDVFGGIDGGNVGVANTGYAGGFVGYNDEGKLEGNDMFLCDVVWGTAGQVGPFTGFSPYDSAYEAFGDTVEKVEKENHYRIYRKLDGSVTGIQTDSGRDFAETTTNDGAYNIYQILYRNTVTDVFESLKDALETGVRVPQPDPNQPAEETENFSRPLGVYASPGKAVLMLDTYTPDNPSGLVPEPGEMLYPCEERIDLTVQKVWDDWNNWDKIRPQDITLQIFWARVDKDGNPVDQSGKPLLDDQGHPVAELQWRNGPDGAEDPLKELGSNPFTMAAAEDGSKWTSTWKKVFPGLPVGMERVTDQNQREILYYYAYTVREVTVAGYATTYAERSAISAPGAVEHVFTVTNKHHPELPFTGSMGDGTFVTVGVGLLALVLGKPRKRKRGRYERRK